MIHGGEKRMNPVQVTDQKRQDRIGIFIGQMQNIQTGDRNGGTAGKRGNHRAQGGAGHAADRKKKRLQNGSSLSVNIIIHAFGEKGLKTCDDCRAGQNMIY